MQRRLLLLVCIIYALQTGAQVGEPADTNVVSKIKTEAFDHSSVMDFAYGITDLSGPRLSWSPGYERAADWVISEFKKMNLVNIHKDYWDPKGKSWSWQKCYVALKAPYYQNLAATPKAWSGSTNGLTAAEVMLVSTKDSASFVHDYKGKLRNKILVFDMEFPPAGISFSENAERFTEDSLVKLAKETDPGSRTLFNTDTAIMNKTVANLRQLLHTYLFPDLVWTFCKEEGAVAILNYGQGHEGTYAADGSYNFMPVPGENPVASITIESENLERIVRLLKDHVPVTVELDVKTYTDPEPRQGFNLVADLPGSDPVLKNELVMIGGHFDSWHGATGATDNGAGSVVMMEVMRILKELKLPLKRTVRIALWGGEEQGLFGSLAYVNEHVASFSDMQAKRDYDKISAYYNLDNGSGKIRGIHLQNNEALRPVFTEWLKPFAGMDGSTVSIKNSGYTDNESFDLVGIPAFQFIQDPLNYDTRTHHTNADNYSQLSEPDLKQAATIIAFLVYQTANRNEKLPRKTKPKPYGDYRFSLF